MIDLKNRIVFVHIPKTAGTSIEKYFLKIRGLEDSEKAALGLFQNSKSSRLQRANDHNSLQLYEQFFFEGPIPEDFRIFTVVRDPLARFWSEWKYRRLPSPSRFPVSSYLSVKHLIRLTENPVAILKDLNSHMAPQCTFTEGRSAHRLRILRFENLASDFSQLCEDWGLPKEPLPHSNEAKRAGKPSLHDLQCGNDFVRRHYAADFEAFGYDPNPPGDSG